MARKEVEGIKSGWCITGHHDGCLESFGGTGGFPSWDCNCSCHGEVTVEVGKKTPKSRAEVTEGK